MGWSNPPVPWAVLERMLSVELRPEERRPDVDGVALSHKRPPYVPPAKAVAPASDPVVPYAELHVHSHYSFLDGVGGPELLVAEAARLGLSAIALTDHDGFYGAPRFAEAAEAHPGLGTVYGAELTLGAREPQNGVPDPAGSHLLLLARGPEGYRSLAGAISHGQLAEGAQKGAPRYELAELAERLRGRVIVLSGCRKGLVRQALAAEGGGPRAAAAALRRLEELFGRESVVVELNGHGDPGDDAVNDLLAGIAAERGLPLVATGNVHYPAPEHSRLAQAVAAIRARRSLDELDGWLPASGEAYLRSGAEMQERYRRYPGAVARSVELARELAFPLRQVRPGLPQLEVPPGHTPMSHLRELVWRGAAEKYAGIDLDAPLEGIGSRDSAETARARIEKELRVIEQKDFPGYFLIVREIVQFARSRHILCQGRGSAAASVVCYLLGITAIDPIFYRLPFERFLSESRNEEPDIDVDFDSRRREEVIQYVYEKYDRLHAAQVANVISYRPASALRDIAKALGYGPGQQDAWSRTVERWGPLPAPEEGGQREQESGGRAGESSARAEEEVPIPEAVTGLAAQLMRAPRHLGIHSGGMVLTDRPVSEICPIEHARMEGRTVLQWDKDDCEWMGLVKFDLLGLGMLEAVQYVLDLVEEHCGERWELETIPREEPAVYDVLCRADTIGLFQVESRAQMGMLPRLLPRCFYDLAVEIAVVRPGPIQGGAVHPYVRRRAAKRAWEAEHGRGPGAEPYPIEYPHPLLEPVLERTLGVPIFQEQLMQMAMAVGDCTAEEADRIRRAMGSKRGQERIESLKDKLHEGMRRNGLSEEQAQAFYAHLQGFASFGFAESHSLSFALLVYASAWLRLHYPAAFLAALLRAQPMGFYSPNTLTADARRHGVRVLRPDILRSGAYPGLEPLEPQGQQGQQGRGRDACLGAQPPVGPFDPEAPDDQAAHRRDGAFAVRLGLAGVRGIGEKTAETIVAEREENGAFLDLFDLVRRTGLTLAQLEALAAADAFAGLGLSRREALWLAGQAAGERADQLAGSAVVVQPPLFQLLAPAEQLAADLWATTIATEGHPLSHLRERLNERGVLSAAQLRTAPAQRRVEVAGIVTHRQRPATASGVTFLNVEDETGLVNVVCGVGVWARYRRVARDSAALLVRGMLERSPEGVVNVVADRFELLDLTVHTRSRDFR